MSLVPLFSQDPGTQRCAESITASHIVSNLHLPSFRTFCLLTAQTSDNIFAFYWDSLRVAHDPPSPLFPQSHVVCDPPLFVCLEHYVTTCPLQSHARTRKATREPLRHFRDTTSLFKLFLHRFYSLRPSSSKSCWTAWVLKDYPSPLLSLSPIPLVLPKTHVHRSFRHPFISKSTIHRIVSSTENPSSANPSHDVHGFFPVIPKTSHLHLDLHSFSGCNLTTPPSWPPT